MEMDSINGKDIGNQRVQSRCSGTQSVLNTAARRQETAMRKSRALRKEQCREIPQESSSDIDRTEERIRKSWPGKFCFSFCWTDIEEE